jgi:hypothetical protein
MIYVNKIRHLFCLTVQDIGAKHANLPLCTAEQWRYQVVSESRTCLCKRNYFQMGNMTHDIIPVSPYKNLVTAMFAYRWMLFVIYSFYVFLTLYDVQNLYFDPLFPCLSHCTFLLKLASLTGRRFNAAVAEFEKFQGWPIYSHGYFISKLFSNRHFKSWRCIQN